MSARIARLVPPLTDYQVAVAQRAIVQTARDTGRAEGYAVGYYDGLRAWVKATAPLLAVAFGGGVVFAVVAAGWMA